MNLRRSTASPYLDPKWYSPAANRVFWRWNMSRSLILGAVMLVLGAGIAAQDKEPQIAWEPDFDATLKAAKADGKPIFVAFIMDNESANNEIAKNHFHDKEIVAESKKFHCLICSVGTHAGTSAHTCPRFGHRPGPNP